MAFLLGPVRLIKKATAGKGFGFRSLFTGVLPLFVLAHFGHHLLTALPVPLLSMIRSEFSLDYAQSGLVISAFSLSYGVGQLPAGWLADRIGPRKLITVGICGVALAGLLVGLSRTHSMMIASLVLMGLVGGGYHPASPPLITASVEPQNRGRALGIHMIGGSASFFLAPLIAAAIAAAGGWRSSYIGLAMPTMVFGIAFYLLLGRRQASKKADDQPAGVQTGTSTHGRRHRLAVFMMLATFVNALLLSIISFIPLYLVDHFGITDVAAAASMALIYSAGLWASPLGGFLSDRWGSVRVMIATCLAAVPAICLLGVAPYGLALGALLVAFGMMVYACAPVSQAYIVDHTSDRNRSTILGVYFFATMEGGGILTPAMGHLIDQFGFRSSFTAAGVALLVVTLLCSAWLRRSHD